MTHRHRGFGIVELLVIILLLAVAAIILFPVFARPRNGNNATTKCTSNQRQITTAIAMLTQERGERLPARETVWSDIGLNERVLRCPSKQDVKLGYVYNGSLTNPDGSPKELGVIWRPAETIATTDGYHVEAPVGVALSPDDIDAKRHENNTTAIASFIDGHVKIYTPDATLFGIELMGDSYASGKVPSKRNVTWHGTELRINLSQPLDGKTPPLVLTSQKSTGVEYGEGLMQTQLGTHGYCVYTAEAGKISRLQPSLAKGAPQGYTIHPPSQGFMANTAGCLNTIIDTARKTAKPQKATGILATQAQQTINITVPDQKYQHYLTVLVPPTDRRRDMVVGLVPTTFLEKIKPACYPDMKESVDGGHLFQFRFIGDVTLVVKTAPANAPKATAGNTIQAIFLD